MTPTQIITEQREQSEQLRAIIDFNHETIELLNSIIITQKGYIDSLMATCNDSTQTICKMSRVIGDQRIRIDLLHNRISELRSAQYVHNEN
jgi:hypothetical protein